MTSHREAPAISGDPAADNTDLYAFVSPDNPKTVTFISNFIPLQEPAGAPNFFKFADDVLYEIMIDNDGDGQEEVTYQFRFKSELVYPDSFLYNVGPITYNKTEDYYVNINVSQRYSLTKVVGSRRSGTATQLAFGMVTPPVNIGPRSTPDYDTALVPPSIYSFSDGYKVFAGQRADGFYVDLGAVFDLGDLRPFQNLHLIPSAAAPGVNVLKGYNVNSIALQAPIQEVTSNWSIPSDVNDPAAVIGVWSSASRQKASILSTDPKQNTLSGPWQQVSRLGMPLINEAVIPLGKKDYWNYQDPVNDSQFAQYYADPSLQNLLPVLYPNVFPNLAEFLKQSASSRPRADLEAVLLTGIPKGIISGFQNFTGTTQADELRVNLAIPPSTTNTNPGKDDASRLGLLGGDISGFPNGRRVFDNTVAVVLRAVAGATYPLVNPKYTADKAAALLTDGTSNDLQYLSTFPYLATPYQGYSHEHDPEDE
jgi:hypothetical protein